MSFNDYWQAQQRRRAVAAAIVNLREGGPAAQTQLYEALRQAILLLPVAELPEGHTIGDVVVGQNVQIRVSMTKGLEDKLYLPCFTSEAHLHRSHPDNATPYVLLPFPAIAQMALTVGAVAVLLDQGGPHSAIVARPMLERLASGQVQLESPPAQAGQPQRPTLRLSPPPRVIAYGELTRLHEWLQQQPGLAQAYLFGLLHGTAKPMLTVGMGFPQSPGQDVVEQLAREASALLGPVGVILLDGPLATLLARQAGAIRFDFTVEASEPPADAPPNGPPPAPATPYNPV